MNEHPSTVEEIYQDYSARYAGILVALTEGGHPRTHLITVANMLLQPWDASSTAARCSITHIMVSMLYVSDLSDHSSWCADHLTCR